MARLVSAVAEVPVFLINNRLKNNNTKLKHIFDISSEYQHLCDVVRAKPLREVCLWKVVIT